jgi:uncharacterized protein YlxW (UPF0749 family)
MYNKKMLNLITKNELIEMLIDLEICYIDLENQKRKLQKENENLKNEIIEMRSKLIDLEIKENKTKRFFEELIEEEED